LPDLVINVSLSLTRVLSGVRPDALAPHKDEATEAEDAEWDPDNDEDASSHDEEEQHADNDEEEDAPTPDVAEATAENATADHDPVTDVLPLCPASADPSSRGRKDKTVVASYCCLIQMSAACRGSQATSWEER